jgi:hypothetical protein
MYEAGSVIDDQHLVLLDMFRQAELKDPKDSGKRKQFLGIGLAPPCAVIGDFICCLCQNRKALIVQKTRDVFAIKGTAVFTKIPINTENGSRFAVLCNTPLESRRTINLYLDIARAYELSL